MRSTINNYSHDGLPLNVTVERDADSCAVVRITAADSAIDLFDIFPTKTLCSIAGCIDAQLSREARKQNAAARAERNIWAYEFRVAESTAA